MTTIQATQPGCEGGTSLLAQIQKVLMLQERTGSGALKLTTGPHKCTKAPWELALSVQEKKGSPLFTLFFINNKVSFINNKVSVWCHSRTNKMWKSNCISNFPSYSINMYHTGIHFHWCDMKGSNVITFLVKTNANVMKCWPHKLGDMGTGKYLGLSSS